ncbi:MAG TPA: hypothetical protein VFS60_15250 [Thermoanaerobaculia bacterium]|nr:hypothetical protein [Thermoanaerobaculia bacterium]
MLRSLRRQREATRASNVAEWDDACVRVVIDLTEEQLARLNEQAAALGVRPEDLARAAVVDLVTKPANDFRQVAEHVLAKNAELYRQLG